MLTLNPSRNGLVAEPEKLVWGQLLADRDQTTWELYLVLSGDRRVIVSYEYWMAADSKAKKKTYYGKPPDYVFTPQVKINKEK